MTSLQFVALVPVKPPALGKSRLREVDPGDRAELARGFALDVVAGCLATPSVARVLAITDDADFATQLVAAGCEVVPDGASGDLNRTLRIAAEEAGRRWPEAVPVVVCADLPALLPRDLEAALSNWSGTGTAFVGDADGSGTTVYLAPLAEFAPAFGPRSREQHERAGAVAITGELRTLRRDVDDLGSLAGARALGVGPRTARVLDILPVHF